MRICSLLLLLEFPHYHLHHHYHHWRVFYPLRPNSKTSSSDKVLPKLSWMKVAVLSSELPLSTSCLWHLQLRSVLLFSCRSLSLLLDTNAMIVMIVVGFYLISSCPLPSQPEGRPSSSYTVQSCSKNTFWTGKWVNGRNHKQNTNASSFSDWSYWKERSFIEDLQYFSIHRMEYWSWQ